MYTYRVLNSQDYITLDTTENIIAKKQININSKIIDALKTVGSHLQYGSSKDYPWISTSNSFTTVVEHYCVPFNELKERPLVAVINDMTESSECKDPNLNIYEFDKIIINLSDNEKIKEALKNNLLCSTKGIKRIPNKNGIKPTPGTKYARKSKEILILNEIKKANIVQILNPLEIDLLYAVQKYCENNNLIFSIEDYFNRLDIFYKNINKGFELTQSQIELFDEMYINNKFLSDIADEVFSKVMYSSNYDILEIYAYLKNKKRIIVNYFLKELGYNLQYVPILEDNIHIVRIGECNKKTKLILSKNYHLTSKSFNKNISFNSNDNHHTIVKLFYYNEFGNSYSLANIEGKDVITDNVFEKLEFNEEKIKRKTKSIIIK